MLRRKGYRRRAFFDDSESVFNTILHDDVSAFSAFVIDEEDTKKYLKFNKSFPKIIDDCPSILSLAAFFGSADIVDYLLGLGAEVRVMNFRRVSTVFFAAAGGNLTIYKKICSIDDSVIDIDRITPCMYAAKMGKVDIVKYIWSRNKNIIEMKDYKGMHAIHHAAQNGHVNVVDFLLSQGVKISETDNGGYTPLIFAAESGSVELIKYLIEHKAKVNEKANDGMTALCIASRNGFLSIVKILIDNGAPFINKGKTSPLIEASGSGHLDIVKFLVEKGARVNSKSDDGVFPLMAAAMRNRLAIFKYLLAHGAKIVKVNNETNILDVACENNCLHVAKYIIETKLFSVNSINPKTIKACYDGECIHVLLLLINYDVDVLDVIELSNEYDGSSDSEKDLFYPMTGYQTLVILLREYEKLGKAKFGDILKIAEMKNDYLLVRYLYENKEFDFTIFNARDEEELNSLKKSDSYAILFKDNDLLKDPKCFDIVYNAVLMHNSIDSIRGAIDHGIKLPNDFLEAHGALYAAYRKEDEDLFFKLMKLGLNIRAGINDPLNEIYSVPKTDSLTNILNNMNGLATFKDFHLNVLAKILTSKVDLYSGAEPPISLIFTIKSPDVINVVKSNLKISKKIIEKNFIMQRCILANAYDYFDWLLSFRPNVFTDSDFDPGCGLLTAVVFVGNDAVPKGNPFALILFSNNFIEKRVFLEKLLDTYDLTGRENLCEIYNCLDIFNDIKLFQKARDHGLRFDNKNAAYFLSQHYASLDKQIIKFYFDNGVDRNELSKGTIFISYAMHPEVCDKISRKKVQEILSLNDNDIFDVDSIIETALGNNVYALPTALIQCGFRTRLFNGLVNGNLISVCDQNLDECIYFINVALENGCMIPDASVNHILHYLLVSKYPKAFYVITKHGYKMREKKFSMDECISLGKKCGIPEDYIKGVFEKPTKD